MSTPGVARPRPRISRLSGSTTAPDAVGPLAEGPRESCGYFFLWRFALIRLRYLCLDIFLRRFLINEPIELPR